MERFAEGQALLSVLDPIADLSPSHVAQGVTLPRAKGRVAKGRQPLQRVAKNPKKLYHLSDAFVHKWSYRLGRYIPKDKSPKIRQIWKIDASPSLFYQNISIHSFPSNI